VPKTSCSISDELRNVITIVRGSADLARTKLEPEHPAAQDVARIIRCCEEAAALTMELRALGRASGDAVGATAAA
jgi:signal transduction histidine kinase